jgi:hypothetical protein
VPLVVTVTKDNIQQIVNPYTGVTAVLFGGSDELLAEYSKIAAEYRGKVSFSQEPRVDEYGARFCQYPRFSRVFDVNWLQRANWL